MWVRLASQQLLGAFPYSLRHPRPQKASMITEELEQAQIGIAQASPQKEVIA